MRTVHLNSCRLLRPTLNWHFKKKNPQRKIWLLYLRRRRRRSTIIKENRSDMGKAPMPSETHRKICKQPPRRFTFDETFPHRKTKHNKQVSKWNLKADRVFKFTDHQKFFF